jgi:hypothetical protein
MNGVQGRALILVRGKTYKFDVDTGVMHDFYLSLDPVGWGAATLVDGVEGNFIHQGTVTFTPSASTPDVVYYACRNHKLMGGKIYVVNPGEEGKIKLEQPIAATAASTQNQPLPDKSELKQKLGFADIFINQSESAKRILASGHDDAKVMHKNAQDSYTAAIAAFEANNLFDAKTKADTAMTLMTSAVRLVPSDSTLRLAKMRYEEMLQGLTGLMESFLQNYEVIEREAGSRKLPQLDNSKVQQLVIDSRIALDAGKYDQANDILSNAQMAVTDALNKLLANRTVSYEMKFNSPAEEFEYERMRFVSLEDTLPSAIEQQQPSVDSLGMMENYVKAARAKREQAQSAARKNDYTSALEQIKAAVEQLETAFKAIGVR